MSITTFDAWPIQWPKPVDGYDSVIVDAAQQAAQTVLFARTGRRWGTATTRGELFRLELDERAGQAWTPMLRNGEVVNVRSMAATMLTVEHPPIRTVLAVRVDGSPIALSEVLIQGSDGIKRRSACWPYWDGTSGEIEVDYTWGISPGLDAALALGEVAYEMVQGLIGAPCRLPSRAVSVSRGGVSLELESAEAYAKQGLLGLPFADAFISSVNPNRLQQQSRVFSPDMPRGR